MTQTRIPAWGWLIFLWFVVFSVYSPSLINEFVWDDHYLIESNPSVQGFKPFSDLEFKPLQMQGEVLPFWRPIPMSLYGVMARAFGTEPYFFHFLNIVLHAIVVTLFFLWLVNFFVPRPTAFVVSVLYAIHPYLIPVVSYASGTADSLAALFALLTLMAWRKASCLFDENPQGDLWQKKLLLGCVGWICALLCKEWALVVPLIAGMAFAGKGKIRFWATGLAAAAFTLGIWFCVRSEVFSGWKTVQGLDMNFCERMACGVASFGFYQLGGLFPLNLRMDRYYSLADSEFWMWFVSGVFLIGLWYWLWKRLKNERSCGAWRGLGWFLVCWFFHSNLLITLNAHFAEHWMYFGYLGLAWAAADVWTTASPSLRPALRRTIFVGCLLLGLLWAGRGFIRQLDWKDDLVFFQSNLQAGARTSRSYFALGSAYAENEFFAEAIPQFTACLEKDPGNVIALWSLAQCYYLTGEYSKAFVLAKELKKINPREPIFDRFLNDCRNTIERRQKKK